MKGEQKKKGFFIPLIIMVLCAALGTIIGKVMGNLFLTEGGTLHLLLSEGIPLSLHTQRFALGTWFIEFGFNIDINLVGFLFVLFFIIFYKKL